jgi:NADPH:quinone reductase-like Zn-dependent oxidoreductase
MLRALARHGTLVTLGFPGGPGSRPGRARPDWKRQKIAGYGIHGDSDANISKALTELVDLARRGSLKPKIDTVVPWRNTERATAASLPEKLLGRLSFDF